jgi:hypothetical protein
MSLSISHSCIDMQLSFSIFLCHLLSVCISLCLSESLSVYLHVGLYVSSLSLSLSLSLSIYLFISLYISFSLSLPLSLSLSLSLNLLALIAHMIFIFSSECFCFSFLPFSLPFSCLPSLSFSHSHSLYLSAHPLKQLQTDKHANEALLPRK